MISDGSHEFDRDIAAWSKSQGTDCSELALGVSGDDQNLDGLSPEQQERLSRILDHYFSCLENGVPIDRKKLLIAHPDLAEPLKPYLESLSFLQDAAAGFRANPGVLEPSEDREARPKTIGDFEIGGEIGRGGMGVVYEARQISLNRRVALKMLPFASLLDSKQIARFRNEAQAAAQLHHPNIVPVYFVGSDRGVHYYAMQYIDGQPLDQAIEELRSDRPSHKANVRVTSPHDLLQHGSQPTADTRESSTAAFDSESVARDHASDTISLSGEYSRNESHYFKTVANLGIQAAEALHSAHESGIVHRDVKPSNLLLDSQRKLWVTDFGLARCRSDAQLTRTGDFVGTIRYMSPEQARGESHFVDHRTDIYSLGVTLYELLALRHPVRAEQPVAILSQLERETPYRLRLWNRNIPVDLENIVQKAMAKARDERYATSQQFADDLRRFLDGKPTNARRPTLVRRVSKWVHRHRLVTSFMGVLAAVVICLLAATGMLITQQHATEAALEKARDNHLQYQTQLARSSTHLALLQSRAGLTTEAEQEFLKAVRLHQEVLESHSGDEQALHNYASTLGNVSYFFTDRDPSQARQFYEQSLAVHQRLVELYPSTTNYQRDLGVSHSEFGSFLARQGEPQRARSTHRDAIDILESLWKQNRDMDSARALAVAYNNLGMTQDALGKLPDAVQSFSRARDAQQTRADSKVATPADVSRLGGIYNNLGMVFERQKRWQDAATSYAQAVECQRKAADLAPTIREFNELIVKHRRNYERVLRMVDRS